MIRRKGDKWQGRQIKQQWVVPNSRAIHFHHVWEKVHPPKGRKRGGHTKSTMNRLGKTKNNPDTGQKKRGMNPWERLEGLLRKNPKSLKPPEGTKREDLEEHKTRRWGLENAEKRGKPSKTCLYIPSWRQANQKRRVKEN